MFGTDLKVTLMIAGLAMVTIASFGFALYKTIIGTRLVKANHPDLYVEGLVTMTKNEKRALYHRVSRQHALAAKGWYFVWLGVVGFAVFFLSVLLPQA